MNDFTEPLLRAALDKRDIDLKMGNAADEKEEPTLLSHLVNHTQGWFFFASRLWISYIFIHDVWHTWHRRHQDLEGWGMWSFTPCKVLAPVDSKMKIIYSVNQSSRCWTRYSKCISRKPHIQYLITTFPKTMCLLAFSVYMLAEHPDIEKRLRQEIYEKVGPTAGPKYEHMREMKYMRAFLNEVLRLYPSVWVVDNLTNSYSLVRFS